VAETFYREDGGRPVYYAPAEVTVERDDRGKVVGARLNADGEPVVVGPMEKMSKSKNNGVDPQALVERYGADTVRLYVMETSPPDQMLEWSDSAVEGAARFVRRLWRFVHEHVSAGAPPALDTAGLGEGARALRRQTHETIAKVSDDVGRRYKFNTAIAAVMELCNALGRAGDASDQGRAVRREGLEAVVLRLLLEDQERASPVTADPLEVSLDADAGGALPDRAAFVGYLNEVVARKETAVWRHASELPPRPSLTV